MTARDALVDDLQSRTRRIRELCDERRAHAHREGYELAPDAFSERVRAVLDGGAA